MGSLKISQLNKFINIKLHNPGQCAGIFFYLCGCSIFVLKSYIKMRYFLIGFMGSGKSYWGKKWSEHFNLPLIDLDHEIEKAAGISIAQIFEHKGERNFRKLEKQILQRFLKQDNYIMSCGGGTPCFFNNMKQMNRKGVTIYLKGAPAILADRLKDEKTKRPLINDMSDEALVSFIAKKLEERRICYAQSFYHLETDFITNDNFERILRRHGS